MTRTWFVTGTDTGVGKTFWTVALLRAAARRGLRAAGLKPVAAGAVRTAAGLRNDDAVALLEASSVPLAYDEVNPYCFPAPVSPHLAAAEVGARIEIARVREAHARLTADSDVILVEGAGGWLAPIGDHASVADLAVTIGAPVVLVAGLRLGVLNHAQLTAESIARSTLPLAGWIANLVDPAMLRIEENISTLTQRLGRAPLARAAFAPAEPTLASVADEALVKLLSH